MHQHLPDYVCRAADEFRAAASATSPAAAEAHRQLAVEFVHLIQCDGNFTSYRMLRKKREAAAGLKLPVAETA